MNISGPAAGRSRAMRLVGWLAVASMLFGALIGPSVGAVSADPGAIYTSNQDGSEVNANIYAAKGDVYLTGGPCGDTGHLTEGDYYFEVTSPNGVLLSSDAVGQRGFHVNVDGYISSGTGSHVTHDVSCTDKEGITLQLLPYADTPNAGGEYKLTIAFAADVEGCEGFDPDSTSFQICKKAKSDNFKVGEEPSSSPSATPTDEPSQEPSQEPSPEPNGASVLIVKFIDEDGDPETDDLSAGVGWQFSVDLTNGEIVDSELETDKDGIAWADVSFDADSAGVTVSEDQQDGYELLDAACIPWQETAVSAQKSVQQVRRMSLSALEEVGPIGELDGTSISFDVAPDDLIVCFFVNSPVQHEEATPTPSFTGGVEGITGTPSVTLPPTDGVPATTAPASDTWRVLLIAMAVLLAGILVVTPKPVSRRQ